MRRLKAILRELVAGMAFDLLYYVLMAVAVVLFIVFGLGLSVRLWGG